MLDGTWATVSELARQRDVDKSAVSRRVKRLELRGLLTTRAGPQGSKLINVAEFDKITGETTDAVRELNGLAAERNISTWPFKQPDLVLAREQARRAAYDADLKELELSERNGEVILIDRLEEAIVGFAETIVGRIGQLPSSADEAASAIARDGAHGARTYLDKIATDLRYLVSTQCTHILCSMCGANFQTSKRDLMSA